MATETEIIERLRKIGVEEAEIPKVIGDVEAVIAMKTLAAYLPMLPENERGKMGAMQPEELQKYITDHAGSFPAFPQDQYDAIHDGTWYEYFKFISR